MSQSNRLQSIMSGEDRTITGQLARLGLTSLMVPYRTLVAARNAGFDLQLRRPHRLGRAAISVGNLTTGGTGKTPMVIYLAKRLLAMGVHPAVLLRGYKATSSGSDEAHVIQHELGLAVPVQVNRNRCQAAQRVLKTNPEIDVFLLDDGFQHRQVHRTLDLLLIDATQPFGFGHLLPRGMLREPVKNLRRADAVIVTRADAVSPSQLTELDNRINQITGQPPIAHAAHGWDQYVDLDGATHALSVLRQSPVVGVCGIGNPAAFERSLRDHVARVIQVHALPDHHHYERDPLCAMLKDAITHRADAVVTTHKDIVKWRQLLGDQAMPLPIYYPLVRLMFVNGEQALEGVLQGLVGLANTDTGRHPPPRQAS